MASANLKGEIRVIAEDPAGHQHVTHKYRSDGFVAAGYSPDGVLANTTRDKWAFIPRNDAVTLTSGWKVRLLFKMDTADGSDASDCVVQIPLTIQGGGVRYLNNADLAWTTDLPAATSANWVELGSGYTIPQGQIVRIGGDYGVISIMDDA